MNRKIVILFLTFLFFFCVPITKAQEIEIPKQSYEKAIVVDITKEGEKDVDGFKSIFQDLKLKVIDSEDKGLVIDLKYGGDTRILSQQKVNVSDTVVLTKFSSSEGNVYQVMDIYRLNIIPYLLFAFLVILILIAGKKGVGSILGLVISLVIIGGFVVPQIINGADPLLVSIIGSLGILLFTTYLAHGVSKQTTIALLSTFGSLIIAALLAIFAVHSTRLAGIGNEDAYSLLLGPKTANLNLQGLLLGGIIIGTLGALNDITTTQAATIFEFKKTDRSLSFQKLFNKGNVIGKEHIASLVNTLVLAYAGSSLAIFIFFVLNPQQQPLWVILNSETIIDEVVRAIAGTIGLITAVPIVSFLASWYVTLKRKS